MSPYIDWQKSFRELENKKDLIILELGVGEGTQYLIDNFKKVISLEYSRYEYEFKKTEAKNHIYIELENDKEAIDKDNILIETLGGIRPDVTDKVSLIINKIKRYKADIVFVDFGFHFRSEVIQELINLNKYKYIAYHDTNFSYYGYDRLDVKNYKIAIEDKEGQGTIIVTK